MRSRVAAKFSAVAVSTLVGTSAFAGLGVFGAATAPNASAAAGCTSPSSGVTVVVQFTTGTAIGCAPGAPATALDALRAAGFSTTGTADFGDSFLCSINGKPISGICPRTPPTNAYWAVFSAKRGGQWTYSNQGVTLLHVPVGGVVGFRFGSGSAPSVGVPAPFPSTSNTHAPSEVTSKPAPVKTPAKPSQKPAPVKSSSAPKPPSTPNPAPKNTDSVASAKPKQTPHAAPATSATPSSTSSVKQTPTASSVSQQSSASSSTKPAVVKATQTVHEGGTSKVIVNYSDGTKATVAPSAATQYKVGATKSPQPTSMAKMSTQVAAPSNTSHPSIWTSGSVPVVPQSKSGGSNLPGIIAGVGVVGAVAAGGTVAIRRRG